MHNQFLNKGKERGGGLQTKSYDVDAVHERDVVFLMYTITPGTGLK